MKKNYVLDTNIPLSDPNAIFGFEDNRVIITQTTLQELDSKKNAPGELGYNARATVRKLEEIRKKAINQDLTNETEINEIGGTIRIVPDNTDYLPSTFSAEKPDNRIIGTCLYLLDTNAEPVILVTNDVSMRINASACHFNDCQEYRNDHVSEEAASYTGIKEFDNVDKELISEIQANRIDGVDTRYFDLGYEFHENEFAVLNSGSTQTVAIYRTMEGFEHGHLYLVDIPEGGIFGVKPKNAYQAAALYALSAPVDEIPLVILKGPAGCAKTFLSLAAGLDAVYDRKYRHVLITRNNVMADAEFGFLPGDLSSKMGPLLAPFMDNLENLIRNYEPKEDDEQIQMQIDDLFATKQVDICAMAYMRGRSITDSYLIVDEAQNASRSQIRDIITRAGTGTKIVVCGDPSQCDNVRLDQYNNGLVFAAQRFMGSTNGEKSICAQITFNSEVCVRSLLAKTAIDVLRT